MKILFPYNNWVGGFQSSIMKACVELGHEVHCCNKYRLSTYSRILNRIDSYLNIGLKNKIKENKLIKYNELLIENIINFKPDIFFNVIGQGYLPQTFRFIRNELGVKTISYVADNPCDPKRNKYFAMALKYIDFLLYPDDIWTKILDRLAPNAKKIKFLGGYDPQYFFPAEINCINPEKRKLLSHEIVFTGGSYNDSAEGAYRAGILGQLAEDGYEIQIWGDAGWDYRKKFYPSLEGTINTYRLNHGDLRSLLRLSKIYLNIPSPQILTGFQPRVFEIAAAKGFQIIDHSDDLYSIFDDNFVSFRSYEDLKEKINYYLKHKDERHMIADKMHEIVHEKYTWKNQFRKVLNILGK